ncbi:MAG TPA: hypothetical protein ENJ12_01050 [Thiolapillus brandeum]|uniref:Uncharacterized protein n=1 Tax=Thiolapillus brandeum TaxID=1076588 RepID=A0A831RUY7_9GAMM|nr:hypothetical protein [Thiolapillus brandeum]
MDNDKMLNLVLNGYDVEMKGLSFIARSPLAEVSIGAMEGYAAHLDMLKCSRDSRQFVRSVTVAPGIVSAVSDSLALREVFFKAHLACCCELLDGWVLSMDLMKSEDLYRYVRKRIATEVEDDPERLFHYYQKLHSADAVRASQILKLVGVFELDSGEARQLSMGASGGNKDVESIHMVPRMACGDGVPGCAGPSVAFGVEVEQPRHVVLIDNDSRLQELYEELNTGNAGRLLAINDDALSAFDELEEKVLNGEIEQRNYVVGIRVDHRMIDDVRGFFSKLARIIQPQAEFFISVGSGNSLDEYEGRLRLMSELFDYLRGAGLEPLRFVLHRGRNLAENRDSPSFGHASIATHEIVHCRLEKNRLV